MELLLKLHDVTISIKRDTDELTIQEMYELFNAALIGVSFLPEQIDNYITQRAEELDTFFEMKKCD
jgi:hypothetical protein